MLLIDSRDLSIIAEKFIISMPEVYGLIYLCRIQKQHAILRNLGTSVTIEPYQQNAVITINGKSLAGSYVLKHLVSNSVLHFCVLKRGSKLIFFILT